MRSSLIAVALLAALAGSALAKLPPLSDDAKAKATEAAAKTAWSDKVGAYQLCLSMERVAETYRTTSRSTGREAPAPVATPACADPGPYVSQQIPQVANKPIEASEAHSPPGMAVSPPSTNATSAQMTGGPKK
jgi:hypothetical protein